MEEALQLEEVDLFGAPDPKVAELDKDIESKYWAAAPIGDIAGKIKEKFNSYRKAIGTSGYGDRIKTSYQRFYGIDQQGVIKIVRDSEGVARNESNHFKSLCKRMAIIATEAKLEYDVKATNSDSKSQIQTDIGRGLCDYYGTEKKMNSKLSDSVLGTIVMFEQNLHCPWEISDGYELTVDGGQVIKGGDQRFEVLNAYDCARNTVGEETQWNIVRVKRNKFDLARIFPEFKDEIMNSRIERDSDDIDYNISMSDTMNVDDGDHTHLHILYHDRTAAIEHGRWTMVCAGQVLRDGGLRYHRRPVVRMSGGRFMDKWFCDSPSVDMLAAQEVMNALLSGISTNALNNVIQMLHTTDQNLSTRKLDEGRVLVTSTAAPTALNLNGSNAEAVNVYNLMMQQLQLNSGINDVARGNPAANIKTNGSMALMLAQAIQFIGDIQKSYAQCAGDVGTILIENLREFGPEMLIGYITGEEKKGYIKEYKKSDIMDIVRVDVDLGNPLMQTSAGRNEMANDWMQKGLIKSARQYITFIKTGNLDQTVEDEFSDELLIRAENEQIKKGEAPPVILFDNHVEHILKHRSMFSTPDARKDPKIVALGLAHVNWHISEMRMVPPDLAAIISGQPLPPPPGAVPPGPGQGQGPNPMIDGTRLPNPPGGTPPQVSANYQQAMQAVPEQPPIN